MQKTRSIICDFGAFVEVFLVAIHVVINNIAIDVEIDRTPGLDG